MAYDDAKRKVVRLLFEQGHSLHKISMATGVPALTLARWKKVESWCRVGEGNVTRYVEAPGERKRPAVHRSLPPERHVRREEEKQKKHPARRVRSEEEKQKKHPTKGDRKKGVLKDGKGKKRAGR